MGKDSAVFLPRRMCVCTVRLATTVDKYIDILALIDTGSAHRLLLHAPTAQQLIDNGCYHGPTSHPTTITGYDGCSTQRITQEVVSHLSVPGVTFKDARASFSLVNLPSRHYQAIIGWPYIQEKGIIIDGAKPWVIFPKQRPPTPPQPLEPTANPPTSPKPKIPRPLRDLRQEEAPPATVPQPKRPVKATPATLKQFKRLIKRNGLQGLGIAMIFDDPDPDSVIANLTPVTG